MFGGRCVCERGREPEAARKPRPTHESAQEREVTSGLELSHARRRARRRQLSAVYNVHAVMMRRERRACEHSH
ncbi:hypothetical protein PybrP1_008445 [[Pythium] brassicae (nom. inval.)]|nr:hypothetical protein PybrP1_008445 [[Pythium] brassicae (nom. inval.)]